MKVAGWASALHLRLGFASFTWLGFEMATCILARVGFSHASASASPVQGS